MTSPALTSEALRDCPACGTAVGVAWEFCPECGTFLGWPELHGLLLVPEENLDEAGAEDVHAKAAGEGSVPAEPTGSSEELTSFAQAAEQAALEARRAQASAARAIVKRESLQRRAAAAEERAERLAAEIPLVRRRATRAAKAVARATAAMAQAQEALGKNHVPGSERAQRVAARLSAAEAALLAAQTTVEELSPRAHPARRAQVQRQLEEARAEHRRAKQAARRAQTSGGTAAARTDELFRAVADAEQAHAAAVTSAQEAESAAATLDAVLAGARAEVAQAPEVLAAAERRQERAHERAQEALAAAERAQAALVLRRKLAALRATPRYVVPLDGADPEDAPRDSPVNTGTGADAGLHLPMGLDGLAPHDVESLRAAGVAPAQAETLAEEAREAGRAVTAAIRLDAGKAERRARRASEAADQRRSEAEGQADAAEILGLADAEGAASRAATTAEQALAAALVAGQPQPRASASASVPAALPAAEPRALAPTSERRVRRAAAAARHEPLASGPVQCPACATGNAVVRTLCCSCGALLRPPLPPPVVPRPTRWERLLLWLGVRHPPAQVLPAGTRPVAGGNPVTELELRRARVGGRSALRSPLRAGLPAALLAVLALVLVGTPLGAWAVHELHKPAHAVQDAVLREHVLVPTSVVASSTESGSKPRFATDGNPRTAWRPAHGNGTGAQLTLSYKEKWDLTSMTVTLSRLPGEPRITAMTITGAGRYALVHLRDVAGPQVVRLNLHGLDRVTITITAVYPGARPGLAACIVEVSFTGRVSAARLSDLPYVGGTQAPSHLPRKP